MYTNSLGFLLFLALLKVSCSWLQPYPGKSLLELCRWMNQQSEYSISKDAIYHIITKETGSSLPGTWEKCSIKLTTCYSCHFVVSLHNINISTCSDTHACRCNYIRIREESSGNFGKRFCGNSNTSSVLYESKSNMIHVDFIYSHQIPFYISLHISSTENVYMFHGNEHHNQFGYVESPRFLNYFGEYCSKYIIQNQNKAGFVQLLFVDFLLSFSWSYLEVFDSNDTLIGIYFGKQTFRPPAMVSSGSKITIRFTVRGTYPVSWFKAKYKFISYSDKYWTKLPITECGGRIDKTGGIITMKKLHGTLTYDCIWIIQPFRIDDNLTFSVTQFSNIRPGGVLEIHKGISSISIFAKSVHWYEPLHALKEEVVSASTGLYIRLQAELSYESIITFSYATYRNEGNCNTYNKFLCSNGRCIDRILRCDSGNHCGDFSDEKNCISNYENVALPNLPATLPNSVNKDNSQIYEKYTESNAISLTLFILMGILGGGIIIGVIAIIGVKLHRQRSQEEDREPLHTISGNIDEDGAQECYDNPSLSDLPAYDPPPPYEDAIKLCASFPPSYESLLDISIPESTEEPISKHRESQFTDLALFSPPSSPTVNFTLNNIFTIEASSLPQSPLHHQDV